MTQTRVRRSKLPRASSLLMIGLGIFALLLVNSTLGIALIVIGLIMYFAYALVAKRPEEKSQNPTLVVQRETVVRIPCKYCGTLVDPSQANKCPGCGASPL